MSDYREWRNLLAWAVGTMFAHRPEVIVAHGPGGYSIDQPPRLARKPATATPPHS